MASAIWWLLKYLFTIQHMQLDRVRPPRLRVLSHVLVSRGNEFSICSDHSHMRTLSFPFSFCRGCQSALPAVLLTPCPHHCHCICSAEGLRLWATGSADCKPVDYIAEQISDRLAAAQAQDGKLESALYCLLCGVVNSSTPDQGPSHASGCQCKQSRTHVRPSSICTPRAQLERWLSRSVGRARRMVPILSFYGWPPPR